MVLMNRYLNIMVPGIFLPLSLGTVYNFSQYSANIAQLFEITKFQTDIGFTLIIFFLGMSAAVFGRFIEMFPKRMSIVSTILFAAGMLTMFISTSFQILPLYYIACMLLGSGTGIGYCVPVKQLLANFVDHAGLSSGLAITGFGCGKFVAAPAIEYLLSTVSLPMMFLILSGAFLIIMSICSWLFRPNPAFISTKYTIIPYKDLVKEKFLTKEYISIWLMFCINISCGLALISQEKLLFLNAGFTEIAILMALTAVANVGGRFGLSTASDNIGRKAVYHWIASLGLLGAFLCYTQIPALLLIGVLLIEFNYGGGFSCLPSLLAKRFGNSCLSTVHSMTLSGWAIAGIIGPLLGNMFTGNTLFLVLGMLYIIGFGGFTICVKRDK